MFDRPLSASSSSMASNKNQTVLQFHPSATSLTAKIHPLVVFNICDSYVRRPDQSERVIGSLLGSVSTDGIVEIKNSYAVPHSESSDQDLPHLPSYELVGNPLILGG